MNKFKLVLSVLVLGILAFAPSAFAASTVTGASVGSQVGSLTAGTGGSVTFSVGATGSGSGNVTWSVTGGLPAGASASTPNEGGGGPWSDTLTITTTNATLAGSYVFTVQAAGNSGTATANGTLTVDPAPVVNHTITASANSNGSISPSGSVSVADGANQSFTITPDSGYQVNYVLVDGLSEGAITSYTFTNVTADHTIAAHFAFLQHTITSSAGANGSISPSGSFNILNGDNATYTISADSGYHIDDVLVDGSSVGAVGSYTFTNVTAPHTISASFAVDAGPMHTITASGNNCTLTPTGSVSVSDGADQSFTIAPDSGYQLNSTLVDGVSVGAVGSYTFTNVTADHTINATCALLQHTITSSADANGSISPSGSFNVLDGDNSTYTMSADSGYHIDDVLVDGVSIGAVSSYTFTNVTAPHTISVSFAADAPGSHTISASAGANGSISPIGGVIVTAGTDQSFTITADSGYHVDDVLVDGVSIGAVSSYTFTNVTADHTIAVSFAINTYTITASAGANGSITPMGAVIVTHGAPQNFNITPDDGYHVLDVLVDDVSQGGVTSYDFANVTADHTVSAIFEEDDESSTSGGSTSGSRAGNAGGAGEGEVLGAERFVFTAFMKLGSRGNEVLELQKYLESLGLYWGKLDGIFGPLTEAAVKAFQMAHPPLVVDGIVGPLTRAELNK